MNNDFNQWLQRFAAYWHRQYSSIFTRFVIAGFILSSIASLLHANDEIDPRKYGTGATITQEQIQEIQDNWPRILAVRPNKYGAARIAEYSHQTGLVGFGAFDLAEVGEEEFITNKNSESEVFKSYATMNAMALPPRVDNSKLACFPPIGNQGSQGSCVGWASTYYQATHEYGLLNGINNKTSSANIRSPKWTYNMINWGRDAGSVPKFAFELLSQNGAASFNEFPYDNNATEWDLNPQHWISALNYRMAPAQFLNVSGPEDLDLIKQILTNGHLVSFVTYAYSWVMTNVSADPSQISNPYAGQNAISWMKGTDGGHHLTIVGYDDDVWIDVNNNKTVDPGEKGAFLVANSWGDWGNDGYIWISYDAFYKNSTVVNGPSTNRLPIAEMLFSIVPKSPNYKPKCIAKFTVSQAARNELSINAGVSSTNAANPTSRFDSGALTLDGGALAFDGQSARLQSATFALDLTDLLTVNTPQRFYLITLDLSAGNPTTLNSYSFVDLVHNREVANSQTPLSVDQSIIQPFVDYTFSDDNPTPGIPTVTITSPSGGTVISGTVTVTANATSSVGVQRVEFYVDDALQSSDLSAPYLFTLDTTKFSNGQHTIRAIVYDTSGNKAQDQETVTIQNNGGDNTPPSVKITNLSDGSAIKGIVNINVTASDNVAVQRVEFYLDKILLATDLVAPYTLTIDVSQIPDGPHTLTAIGYDAAGNTSSHTINVTIQNTDNQLPQVKITSPANGATVSGTISVTVNATDNKKITRVQLFIEKSPIGLDFSAPYSFLVDLSRLGNGKYTLTAVAYDDDGNTAEHSVVITLKNPK